MLSLEWYRDNMPRYKAGFEDARIELPRHADILADHRLLRMQQGVARLTEHRTRGGDGNRRHGDSAIAGALAYYASYSNHREYAYTPVSSRSSQTRLSGPMDEREQLNPRIWGERLPRSRRGSW